MKIHVEDTLPWPRDRVFTARRDWLPELAGDMSNVDRIRVKSEGRSASGTVDLETVWVGAYAHVPLALQGSLPPEALSWIEAGRFDPRSWTHTWKITVLALPEVVHAEGIDTFEVTPDGGTKVTVDGEFSLDPSKLPVGVPGFLLRGVLGKVERFLLGMIETSMHQTHLAIDAALSRPR